MLLRVLGELRVARFASCVPDHSLTSCLLVMCVVCVMGHQLVEGGNLACGTPSTILPDAVNKHCLRVGTFTVLRYWTATAAHPGLGHLKSDDELLFYILYPWVPYFMVAQAAIFYAPCLVSFTCHGRRMQAHLATLKRLYPKTHETKISRSKVKALENKFFSALTTNKAVNYLFRDQLFFDIFQDWALIDLLCELWCAWVVVFQVLFTNAYLGGHFLRFEWDFLDANSIAHRMVFPDFSMCVLHDYSWHDLERLQGIAICSMLLNSLYSKLFVAIMLWYAYLAVISVRALLSRVLLLCLLASSASFNQFVVSRLCSEFNIPPKHAKQLNYAEWWYMHYVTENLEGAGKRRFLEAFSAWLTEDSAV